MTPMRTAAGVVGMLLGGFGSSGWAEPTTQTSTRAWGAEAEAPADEPSGPSVGATPATGQQKRDPRRPRVPGQPAPDVPLQPVPKPQGDLLSDFEVLGLPFDFSGFFWVDTGYLDRDNEQDKDPNQNVHYMQGRYVLSATYGGEYGDWFAMARVQLMGLVNEFAKSQYEAHALDVFVQLGHKRWGDVQIGRFLGWQVYYRGQGIELFTAEEAGALDGPRLYLLDNTRGYRDEAGQAAIHLYPFEFLAIEVAAVYGQENQQNNIGVRPVVVANYAGAVLVLGYEFQDQFKLKENDRIEVKQHGFAAQLRYTLGPVTFGGNLSRLRQDRVDIRGEEDTELSFDRTSYGGFVDVDFWRNVVGLGYHRTFDENEQGEVPTHDQLFVSYLFRLPFDGVSLKAVYGYARAHLEDVDNAAEWENEQHSFRLRVAYVFD